MQVANTHKKLPNVVIVLVMIFSQTLLQNCELISHFLLKVMKLVAPLPWSYQNDIFIWPERTHQLM